MRAMGLDLPVEPRKRTIFVVDAPEARHPGAPLIIDPSGIWMRPEHGQWLAATVPAFPAVAAIAAAEYEPAGGLAFEQPALPTACCSVAMSRPAMMVVLSVTVSGAV